MSSHAGSYTGSHSSVVPWESINQVSSRATRSTDSLTIPRERHWESGGSETSRVSDTRTANWVADRPYTGHGHGSVTSSRRSSQRSSHSHQSRPRDYEGGTASFLRRQSGVGPVSEYSFGSQGSGRSQDSGGSDSTILPSHLQSHGSGQQSLDGYTSVGRESGHSQRTDTSNPTIHPAHTHVSGSRYRSRTNSSETSEPRNRHQHLDRSRRSETSSRRPMHHSSDLGSSPRYSSHRQTRDPDIPYPGGPWRSYHGSTTITTWRSGHRPITEYAETESYHQRPVHR